MSDAPIQLTFAPLGAEHVPEILTWRYEPPYDIYNMGDGTEDPIGLAEAIEYFSQPKYHFKAILKQSTGELAAFCSFGPDGQVGGGDYGQPAIDIGLGVHPANTGRGLGRTFVAATIAFAEQNFDQPRLRVTIAEFNRRAQKVWTHHRFVPVRKFESNFGKRPFIIYVRE